MVIRRKLMIGAAVAAIGTVSVAAVAVAGNGEACGCLPDVVDDRAAVVTLPEPSRVRRFRPSSGAARSP